MARNRSYTRGEDYFRSGKVTSVVEHQGSIVAMVQGSRTYHVRLADKQGHLEHSCTCPVGEDGGFCKHCVATALAWLENCSAQESPAKSLRKPSVTLDDVREYLLRQERDALADILIEQATHDERLCRRLLLMAAAHSSADVAVESFRQALDRAEW